MAPPEVCIRLICTGKRWSKDGVKVCNQVLGVVEAKELDGQVVKIKCPKCDTVTEFK